MAGYTRQSTFADGDTITAALFNNEYNQLLNAFSNTGGHKHDGTANEGPVIGLIGDAGVVTPLNKVLIDSTNDHIEFWIDVSSTSVQQLYIADGAIIPVTDSDIDLGTTSLRFKDTYTDTITTTGNATIGGDLTVTGSATISGNLTFGDADTDSINLAAEIDSDIIPNTDGTYDLGSATKEWQDLYIDGTANIDSLVADTADINGGTIDGATIATSDITVGAGKTLNVSAGTLTLADNQISGDKVEGGTIAATTITTLTSTTGNITNVNATTLDTTNIEVTNLKAKDGTAAGSIADSTGVVTLGSSVLTTTDINGGTIDGVTIGGTTAGAVTFTDLSDGTITIAGFADEDNMSSDSATLVPTQQSVKAYVDSQVTAQDLDVTTDSGTIAIDLDSETLTVSGGTGLDSSATGNAVTLAIDSTVATLTGTQTLTNKTLTTPVISSISNTGTLTLPTSTDTLVGRATTDTLTNKTLTSATLTSPVINTGVSGTAFLDDDTFATATASTLASSESIKAYVDTTVAATNEVVEDTTPQLGGNLDVNGYAITGSTVQINGATGELMISATENGPVALRYDNNLKFSTKSDGVNITGELECDSLDVDGDADILQDLNVGGTITGTLATAAQPNITSVGTLTGLVIQGTGSQALTVNSSTGNSVASFTSTDSQAYISYLDDSTTGVNYVATGAQGNDLVMLAGAGVRAKLFNNGDFQLYEDTATTAKLFWDASAESLGIGTTSPSSPNGFNKCIEIEGSSASLVLADSDATTWEIGSAGGNLKFFEGTDTFMTINTSGNVGIGTTSPQTSLSIETSGTQDVVSPVVTGQTAGVTYGGLYTVRDGVGDQRGLDLKVYTANVGLNTAMRIDSSGNVGIGSTSPSSKFTNYKNTSISGTAGATLSLELNTEPRLLLTSDSSTSYISSFDSNPITFSVTAGNFASSTGTERMRIDSSGNLLVGKTSTSTTSVGSQMRPDGFISGFRASDAPALFARGTDDGDVVVFRKNSSTIGRIGTAGGDVFIGGDTHLRFTTSDVRPCDSNGDNQDNFTDLGDSVARFDDIYATNGTIQTSDRNEKQDIEALTDAETRVAVAAKGLLRKFRWQSAVEEKGDEARTHFGIIAQDLQDAFTAEGLDAGDYAMFISSTWTNDDGVEQTRLGVRYSELLAFIIAAI